MIFPFCKYIEFRLNIEIKENKYHNITYDYLPSSLI